MFFVGLDLAVARASARAVLHTTMQCSFGWWDYREDGVGIIPGVVGDRPFVLAIDGPQGWAATGTQRCCEERLNTPGKAPFDRNPKFAGEYIANSVDLFGRLRTQPGFRVLGLDDTEENPATLIEVFPGRAWRVLTEEPLPQKDTAEGLHRRRELLERRGLTFPTGSAPNHDQLDAALAAWIAHELHRDEDSIRRIGQEPCFDRKAGCLREGFIVQPAPPAEVAPRPLFEVEAARLGFAPGVNPLKLNRLADVP